MIILIWNTPVKKLAGAFSISGKFAVKYPKKFYYLLHIHGVTEYGQVFN